MKNYSNEHIKENSKSVWGACPAGTTFAPDFEKGTKDFFDAVLQKRFLLEVPWLDHVVNFERWRHKKVLEIGFGAGYDAYQFCKYGAHYTGIDITPDNPRIAAQHLNFYGYQPTLMENDVETMRFNAEFDLVYSFGVLHHVPDIVVALRNIHGVLKENGECIITVYNKHSIFYWLQIFLNDWLLNGKFLKMSLQERISQIEFTTSAAQPLVTLYSSRTIKKLIKQAGFSIKQTQIHKLVREDLPDFPVIRRLYKYIPQSWLNRVGRYVGWYICVHAKK